MDTLSILLIGIFAGFMASLILDNYSLGLIGNSFSGLIGAMTLGDYASLLLGLPKYAGMFVAGILGAVVILFVFKMLEALLGKKHHLL